MKKPKTIPFEFVLEQLYALDPVVRPMFGCHAIYVGGKIVLSLRLKEEHTDDNGVWVATGHEHHTSLRRDLPSLRSIRLFGVRESGWQNLPYEGERFEEEVMTACALILKGDKRIGKTPAPPRKKKKKKE